MRLSEEAKIVDEIRAGRVAKESAAEQKLREAQEEVVIAKTLVKAAFMDLQRTMFLNSDYYSPSLLAETKRFEEAIHDCQKAENKLLVARSPVVAPVGMAAVKPGDLSPVRQGGDDIRALELTADDTGV